MNGPMYYPPGPGGYPPQGGRGMMGYPQPEMMPHRPRYPGGQPMPGMPVPAPYGQGPQGYGIPPGYPRPAPRPRGEGMNGARGGAPGVNGARPGQGPPQGNRPAASGGAPARGPSNRQSTAGNIPGAPEGITLTPAALANASPMEQKQMLGEVLFLKIAPAHAELAGKITGMLLEIDNSELLHLIENHEALNGKVNEAIAVLNEYSTGGREGEAPAQLGQQAQASTPAAA